MEPHLENPIEANGNPVNSLEVKVRDIAYRRAEGEVWLARIYQPCGKGPFPALLDVHGGVWSEGDRTNNVLLDNYLAASGLVVAAVDFRLAPRYPYPAQVADINFSIRWLKVHAGEFNACPDRIGTMGTSSGGHTVVLSAMRPHDPRYTNLPLPEAPAVDATVAWVMALWPVLDPYKRYRYAQKTARERLVTLTEGYFLTEEAMQEGNPQLLLDRQEKVQLPPVLVIQGTADANIPLAIPEQFARSYRQAGGHLDLELFTGMPHGFAYQPGPETRRALQLMTTWVSRQLVP